MYSNMRNAKLEIKTRNTVHLFSFTLAHLHLLVCKLMVHTYELQACIIVWVNASFLVEYWP